MSDWLYFAVRAVARLWVGFFFRRLTANHLERIPEIGPVILAPNHPNNFVDSLVLGVEVRRKVHYMANATLFRNFFLRRLLPALGAVPVIRRTEAPAGQEGPERNAPAFAACRSLLGRGQVLAIYPEGTTHAEPRVQRIRTGAVRIALEAEALHDWRLGVKIIPVGINFSHRKSFRALVFLNLGRPIETGRYREDYLRDPQRAVAALTAEIQAGMERQVYHIPRRELDGVVHDIESLYRQDLESEFGPATPAQELALRRSIVESVEYFNDTQPERLLDLERAMTAHTRKLRRLGLDGANFRELLAMRPAWKRLLGDLGLYALGAPPFFYGAVNNFLAYAPPRLFARLVAKKETDYATARLLVSLPAVPVCYAGQTYLVARAFGWRVALLYLVTLPVTGLFAYGYRERLKRFWARLMFHVKRATGRRLIVKLRRERRALLAEIERGRAEWITRKRASGARHQVSGSR